MTAPLQAIPAGTLVRRAVVALVEADPVIQTLCGRPADVIVPWKTVADAQWPVLAYQRMSDTPVSGIGDARRVSLLMAACAEGDGALDTAEALVQRVRELLTAAAFTAQGLTAWVVWSEVAERTNDPEEPPTIPSTRVRVDLDVPVRVMAPYPT